VARVDPDKAIGALLGLAAGETLGAPDGNGTPATDMTLRLATSLIELGGYDADRTLRAYVDWYRTDPPGMSDHLRQVLGSIEGGADAFRATSTIHLGGDVTSGNGAVMRTTPIGIAFAGRDDALRDATLADAALTHFDPLAGKVALLHNQVVSWVLTGGPQLVFDQLKDPEWLDDRIEDVVIPATAGVLGFAVSLSKSEPGSALASIAIALAAFFNADGFEQGLEWAVSLGGDTDTNGAVTGALLGARLGAAAIPQPLVDSVERRAEVEGIGQQLAAMAG